MQTWIFQGNPDEYDIDAYLESRPAQLVWLVTRYNTDIGVGDQVYLWRNQGKGKAVPGIVAEGTVTAGPELRGEDPEGAKFWRTKGPRANSQQVRAVLRLTKVAKKREVLRRDWCLEDPILQDLPNLRMQAATNYRITPAQAFRLDALWSRTGRDWTHNESVAGLMAYAQTYGLPVSRLPGSPVARVAMTIGRAVSGVYAKVMNFRSIDPRATGDGMSGAGDVDKLVWREFYDETSATLRTDVLIREFNRLWDAGWVDGVVALEAKATVAVIDAEAARLEELPLEHLFTKYHAQRSQTTWVRPETRLLGSRVYVRNPLVIAIGRMRATYTCEIEDCLHPQFVTVEGIKYSEVHHIIPLADGGDDTIENVACLCPAHHREIHLGTHRTALTAQLVAKRGSETTPTPASKKSIGAV